MILDNTIAYLIRKYGIKEVLAALCREAAKRGVNDKRYFVFVRKLNRVYEWLVLK